MSKSAASGSDGKWLSREGARTPKRRATRAANVPERAVSSPIVVLPRELQLKVTLKLLSWYLRDNLPQFLPDHFAPNPQVFPIESQGWSNNTFIAVSKSKEEFIVKMKRMPDEFRDGPADAGQWADYHKEEWIMSHLPPSVPAPKVLTRGIGYVSAAAGRQEYAFMVQTKIPHGAANKSQGTDARLEFLRKLAAIGREINTVHTRGYGRHFRAASTEFSFSSWEDFVRDEIKRCKLAELVDAQFITPDEAFRAERRLLGLCAMQFTPTLFHGDFIGNWENVLVDDKQTIHGIIDWEFAGSGPAVHCELAVSWYVPFRDGKDEKEIDAELLALCEGYKISQVEFERRYREEVEGILLGHALLKLQRYHVMRRRGELDQHPWRVRFCNNAVKLIRRLIAHAG